MTADRLAILCKEKFGIDVDVFHCEAKVSERNTSGEIKIAWPQHLLRIFERRLRGCIEHGSDPILIAEIERFVSLLRTMPNNAPLWIWQARSSSATFSGWADEHQIIFGIPDSTEVSCV